jgi:hypothetical protein
MTIDGIDWVSAMRDTERFALTTTITDGGELLTLEHLRTGLKASILTGAAGEQMRQINTRNLCEQLAHKFTESRMLEHGTHAFARQVRCVYANQLIQVIARHGRRFLYSPAHDRVARLVYDKSVYLMDAKSGVRVVLRNNGEWAGFSHGGTLRDLVTMMRDYVMKGTRIGFHFIGLERTFGKGNIWGYTDDQMLACRNAAQNLPIIVDHEKERAA